MKKSAPAHFPLCNVQVIIIKDKNRTRKMILAYGGKKINHSNFE